MMLNWTWSGLVVESQIAEYLGLYSGQELALESLTKRIQRGAASLMAGLPPLLA